MLSPLIEHLVNAFRCLPGIGPKSAQRMVFYLLQRKRKEGLELAHVLIDALNKVGHCQSCRNLCETLLCEICANSNRDAKKLCIVESPADALALEQTGNFNGRYFILSGHLSPLDGIGPEELGLPHLYELVKTLQPEEVILATNPTVEGEATAYYLSEVLKKLNIDKITRIAHGVPAGGELEFIDMYTLSKALEGRLTL